MAAQDDGEPALTGIELADAVEAVRQGLITGAARGAGQAVRFEVGEIQVEFTVELQRVTAGRGGVKAWVVEAGAERTRTTGRTHTVTVSLTPKNSTTGGYVEIGAPDEGDASGLAYAE